MSQPFQPNHIVPDLQALLPAALEDAIISRTVYRDETMRVILFGFAAGEGLSEHTSSYPAILHFLSGSAAVTLGEQSLNAQSGTWVHMPAHLPHSINAHEATTMLLMMMGA
jgi:quercetin dioxygenase-like cupin family protein